MIECFVDNAVLERKLSSRSEGDDASEDTDEEWQGNTQNVSQRLSRLFYYKTFSDLTVELEDGGEVYVHKLILSIYSPVFERMFYGSLPYKESRIVMKDISASVFKWILAYMYLGIVILEDVDMAKEIYAFAHEKQMDFLVARCSLFLSERVTWNNVKTLMPMATLYSDANLRIATTVKLFERRDSIFASQEIGEVPKQSLLDIISNKKIYCTEKEIFQSIYNWAKIQVRKRGEAITSISIREEMEDFLPSIQFLTMSIDYFISVVMKTGIFSSAESLSILSAISKKDVELPSFIAPERMDRFIREEKRVHFSLALNNLAQCNMSFIYNHAQLPFNDKIIVLRTSENILIRSISLKPGCFTGSWKIHVLNLDEKKLGVSCNDYSPWRFDELIPIEATKCYIVIIEGTGKRTKHNMMDYEACVNNVTFAGFAIACKITIDFLL